MATGSGQVVSLIGRFILSPCRAQPRVIDESIRTMSETNTHKIGSPGGRVIRRPVFGGSEDGFTIVESLVSMMLVLLFFVTFTISVAGALRGSRNNRLAQTGTVVVTEHLEAVRGLAWLEVAMTEVDPAAPMIDVDGVLLLASETGMEADESLVVSIYGIISPKVIEVVEGTEYTVWTYVTSAPRGLLRVTVLATWEFTDDRKTFRSSTFLAEPAGG